MRRSFLFATLVFIAEVYAIKADAGTKVRRVEVSKDQIIQVKTASTIATIIQVPDRPNSVVLGNQSAFQVEYLDTAVTVKSLIHRGRGNLYIYTDYRRYSVELVIGDESSADYIVYLDEPAVKQSPSPAPSSMRWKASDGKATQDGLTLSVQRIGERIDGLYLIEFILTGKPGMRIEPAWFWVSQGGKQRPIQNLFLSRLEIPSTGKVSGTVVLNRREIEGKHPIQVEVRRRRTLALFIPKVALWK